MNATPLHLEEQPTFDYNANPGTIDYALSSEIDIEFTRTDSPESNDLTEESNDTAVSIGSKVLALVELTAQVCEVTLLLGALGLKDKLDKAAIKAAAKKEARQNVKAKQRADLQDQQTKGYFTKKDQKYERKSGRRSPRRR